MGQLAIDTGGNFHMLIDPVDGPSYGFVSDLALGADGTLTLDLPAATGGTAAIGTYPQIYTNTAELHGTIVANISSPNGLYETTLYDDVIDSNVTDQTGLRCVATGVPANSLLLSFGCVYDDARPTSTSR